jgi:hypothetical protein
MKLTTYLRIEPGLTTIIFGKPVVVVVVVVGVVVVMNY